ncbi:MAG: hypothetical protein KF878_05625 [Planctomycetes bacterium]|nr:hypothetical protein [Planctomycetota bacterium]MCW8137490.1 hypothetical protein [Planctomycetota bacterium]
MRRHRLIAPALLLALVSGCASLTEAPRLFGGTRALIARPFPITQAEFRLGSERPIVAGPVGLVLTNLYWLVDLPMSFVMDMLIAPISYFAFDGGEDGRRGGGEPRQPYTPPTDADGPPPLLDGGDPLAPL